MVMHPFLKRSLLLLGYWVAFAPCYALDTSDIPKLKAGTVLSVADPAAEAPLREMAITHVHSIRADGAVWYQIEGTYRDGQEGIVYVDFTTSPVKIETTVKKLSLRNLVDRPRKFLDAVEESEKGELVYEGSPFQYADTESDDGVFERDGDKTSTLEFNYLVFTSKKDANLSIQIMRWDDDKFDTYLVKRVQPGDVKVK
ncbi:MAG: hypothetical protein WA174_12465 [Rhodoferax sp.]